MCIKWAERHQYPSALLMHIWWMHNVTRSLQDRTIPILFFFFLPTSVIHHPFSRDALQNPSIKGYWRAFLGKRQWKTLFGKRKRVWELVYLESLFSCWHANNNFPKYYLFTSLKNKKLDVCHLVTSLILYLFQLTEANVQSCFKEKLFHEIFYWNNIIVINIPGIKVYDRLII